MILTIPCECARESVLLLSIQTCITCISRAQHQGSNEQNLAGACSAWCAVFARLIRSVPYLASRAQHCPQGRGQLPDCSWHCARRSLPLVLLPCSGAPDPDSGCGALLWQARASAPHQELQALRQAVHGHVLEVCWEPLVRPCEGSMAANTISGLQRFSRLNSACASTQNLHLPATPYRRNVLALRCSLRVVRHPEVEVDRLLLPLRYIPAPPADLVCKLVPQASAQDLTRARRRRKQEEDPERTKTDCALTSRGEALATFL